MNRGASFADGKRVYNLLDGHTVAVDAKSGMQFWRTKVVDVGIGETITMAPIIVKDMVMVGSSGGEMGVRGFLANLDLATGWRAYTIPWRVPSRRAPGAHGNTGASRRRTRTLWCERQGFDVVIERVAAS